MSTGTEAKGDQVAVEGSDEHPAVTILRQIEERHGLECIPDTELVAAAWAIIGPK